MSEEKAETQEVFRVGIGRRIALMALFGMMLPFFISMPVMTALRAVHGNIIDAGVIAAPDIERSPADGLDLTFRYGFLVP